MTAPIHGVLQKDDNGYPVAGGVSSVNPVLVLNAEIDPSTGRLLVNNGGGGSGSITVTDGVTTLTGVTTVDFTSGATVTSGGAGIADVAISGGGSGTVTSVSVASANGLAGTVANPTTTPAITLSTTVTGILKGNGTAISAGVAGDVDSILPTQTGNSGKFLTTNGTNSSWGTPSGSGTVNSGTGGQMTYYATTGTAVSGNANATISGGALTLGVATSSQGSLILSGSTSGTTTLTPNVAATGTLTLPAATDTLVGKATTDTFTNKTFDTAGTGNSFKINGNAITSNTGSGAVNVLATSPTLVTPILGVAAATSINKVAITAPATGSTLTIADGKTLTQSNTLTYTGTDGSSVAFGTGGTVLYTTSTLPLTVGSTTIASGTSTRILYDNAGVLGEYTITGTGTVVAMQTSPSFTTPSLGVATATSINGNILTTGSSTYTGTAAATYTFPGASATIVGTAATQTLTNKRITRRVVTTTQSATPTINTDNTDMSSITGLAQAITSMTTNLSGTPVQGDFLEIQITDNGTARGLTWGTSFVASTVALPTTTVISTLLHVLFEWDSGSSKWVCVATA